MIKFDKDVLLPYTVAAAYFLTKKVELFFKKILTNTIGKYIIASVVSIC